MSVAHSKPPHAANHQQIFILLRECSVSIYTPRDDAEAMDAGRALETSVFHQDHDYGRRRNSHQPSNTDS